MQNTSSHQFPDQVQITPVAENALMLRFGESIHPNLPEKIAQAAQQIQFDFQTLGIAAGHIECIPAYTTLLVKYPLNNLTYSQCVEIIQNSLKKASKLPGLVSKTHLIPVCYDLSLGIDLHSLAKAKGLAPEKVIKLHSQTTYQVYAVGFSPAFAYLGSVHPKICHPRHTKPRLNIPAGSVGIADNQTAVYPISSPAGWQIIGQCPIDLSLNSPENLTRFQVGDKVQFLPISLAEFNAQKNISSQSPGCLQ